MGFLAEAGQGIGQFAAGGMTDAAGLASRATGLGTLSMGADIAGDVFQGIGGLQQGRFAAQVARQNALAALQAGGTEESISKMRYGALEASQKAAQAANGVSVDSGSAQAVRRSTETMSALDALAIRFNAARSAYALNTQATLDERAGANAFAKGALDAGRDFISGSASLADKWLSYKRSGIGTVSAGAVPAGFEYGG